MGDPVAGTILVVDDDRDAREIIARMLESQGYTCVLAEDGPACLDLARREAIDVIVLDVMMPGMDGLEVCARLYADSELRKIPVILLTAKDDLDTRKRGMELGVSEFLTKPINKQELFTRVRSQLHSRSLVKQLEEADEKLGKEPLS
ncbi:MAG: hypothetical protein KatS3mg076_0843 [Candidatus Binatia bacterium]|nr:MAG: hypothetical protein KatS3mg076_0843 [Candidatus Binatia bacterium]